MEASHLLLAQTSSVAPSASAAATATSSAAPSGSSGSGDATEQFESGALAIALVIAFVGVLGLALYNARRKIAIADSDQDPRDIFFQSALWRFSQTLTLGLLAIGAVWSTIPKGPTALTVTLLILIMMVTLVPVVEKVVFPGTGGEIDLVKKAIKSDTDNLSQETTQSQIVLAVASQIVAESQSTLLDGRVTLKGDDAAMSDLAGRVLDFAAPTLAALLVPPPPKNPDGTDGAQEPLRITAFIQAKDARYLSCVYCWPADPQMTSQTKPVTLELAQDRASQVFRTSLNANLQDLATSQRPPNGSSAQGYHGIAILPLISNGETAGIVCVERFRAERFDPVQMAMARTTAALLSSALVSR